MGAPTRGDVQRVPVGDAAARLERLHNALGAVSWSAAPGELRLLHVEGDTEGLLGVAAPDLDRVAMSLLEVVFAGDQERMRTLLNRSDPPSGRLLCRVLDVHGATRWTSTVSYPVTDQHGQLERIDGVTVDITARSEREADLVDTAERLQLALDTLHGAWWEWDVPAGALQVSPRWFELLGLEPGSLAVTPELLFDHVIPEERERVQATLRESVARGDSTFAFESCLRHADGHEVPALWRGAIRAEPHTLRIMGSTIDLTATKRSEERQADQYRQLRRMNRDLRRQARIDQLTGVANRRGFDEFLERTWRQAQLEARGVGLIICDVDEFKRYNDHLGHVQGDRCLMQVARSISDSVRDPGDLVARYGGEEFAVVLASTSQEEAQEIAERIRADLAALALPHPFSHVSPRLTMSFGVAWARPGLQDRAQTLLVRADDALLHAKQAGRNRIVAADAPAAPAPPAAPGLPEAHPGMATGPAQASR